MARLQKKYTKKILVNREMVARKSDYTDVDEYWKRFGWGPSYREIAAYRKKSSLGNIHQTIRRLVRLGVLKQVKGMERSVRPVYINFRNLE